MKPRLDAPVHTRVRWEGPCCKLAKLVLGVRQGEESWVSEAIGDDDGSLFFKFLILLCSSLQITNVAKSSVIMSVMGIKHPIGRPLCPKTRGVCSLRLLVPRTLSRGPVKFQHSPRPSNGDTRKFHVRSRRNIILDESARSHLRNLLGLWCFNSKIG